jgi:hypothetical protein
MQRTLDFAFLYLVSTPYVNFDRENRLGCSFCVPLFGQYALFRLKYGMFYFSVPVFGQYAPSYL